MTVRDKQNIVDICLQEFGDLQFILEIVKQNQITVNSELESGQELIINNFRRGNELIKEWINVNNIIIANGIVSGDVVTETLLSIQWPIYVDLLEAININKVIQV